MFQEVPENYKKQNFKPTLPRRSTRYSAGYDFYIDETIEIPALGNYKYTTDVCVMMHPDEVLKVYIRSSLALKKNITLTNHVGVIDHDYYANSKNYGNMIISLKNNNPFPVIVYKGDKVAQGIFEKYYITDNDETEEERIGGCGSTG